MNTAIKCFGWCPRMAQRFAGTEAAVPSQGSPWGAAIAGLAILGTLGALSLMLFSREKKGRAAVERERRRRVPYADV